MAEKAYIERSEVLDVVRRSDSLEGAYIQLARLRYADVRPVVRCRECKHSYDSVGGWCCSHGICVDCIVREDFFCADGEKREES